MHPYQCISQEWTKFKCYDFGFEAFYHFQVIKEFSTISNKYNFSLFAEKVH